MNFIISYWRELLILVLFISLSITLFMLYNKPTVTVTIEDTKQIERLREQVNKLNSDLSNLQTAYDNKQTTVINNIINKNNQDGKKINAIPLYSNTQLDSVWASKSNTEKDSIPRGYWDILNQKTGGRSIKDLRVQRDIQE